MKRLIFVFLYLLFLFPSQILAFEINQDFLDQFDGVAIKTIRKNELRDERSELNGIKGFREILGDDRNRFNTKIIYLNDKNIAQGDIRTTWYRNKAGSYNLYYQANIVMRDYADVGDLMLLGKIDNENLIIVIAEKNSQASKNILDLLNLHEVADGKRDPGTKERDIGQMKPIIQATGITQTDTSNLIEDKDIKIYRNTKTNRVVLVGKIGKIKDGDTVVLNDLFNVRMLGIDAPESKQTCKDKNNKEYDCGIKSTEHLRKLVGNSNITCVNNGNEKYGRFLFVCKNRKYADINREMVRNGWAVAYYADLYIEEEAFARENKLGIWAGEFERPEEWRKSIRR